MGRAIRWVFVALVGCTVALVAVGALVRVDSYHSAVVLNTGGDRQLRFASADGAREAQRGVRGKKLTVVVDGVGYETSYTVSNEQPATITVYDDNLPALADGASVRVRGASQSVLQRVVGL